MPPGNNEWHEARWPVPMPGDDVPLSPLAWRLLFQLRTTPHAHPDLVTAYEVVAAQDAVRQPPDWRPPTRQRMQQVFEELLRYGYVEEAERVSPPAQARARAAPPPYRLTAALAAGDTGLGLPSLARTFLARLRTTPAHVLTAEDIGQAERLAATQDAEAGARLVRAAIAALVDAGYLVPAPGEVRHA